MSVAWTLKVVDCSYWNSFSLQALWDLGVRVLVLRASSGATYRDPKFKSVYDEAKKIGFKVLAYHVMHPFYSATANVANFVGAVDGFVLDGPPVLDCELTGGMGTVTIQVRVKDAFFQLKALFGAVINYTRKYWWDDYMGTANTWAKQFPLWVASYWESLGGWLWPAEFSYTSTIPADYAGEAPFLWQFNEKGYHFSVSTGNIDKNAAFPDFEAVLTENKDMEEILKRIQSVVTALSAAREHTQIARAHANSALGLRLDVIRGIEAAAEIARLELEDQISWSGSRAYEAELRISEAESLLAEIQTLLI